MAAMWVGDIRHDKRSCPRAGIYNYIQLEHTTDNYYYTSRKSISHTFYCNVHTYIHTIHTYINVYGPPNDNWGIHDNVLVVKWATRHTSTYLTCLIWYLMSIDLSNASPSVYRPCMYDYNKKWIIILDMITIIIYIDFNIILCYLLIASQHQLQSMDYIAMIS